MYFIRLEDNVQYFTDDFAQTSIEQAKAAAVAPAKSNQEKTVQAGGSVKAIDPKTATLVANQEKVTYEVRFSTDATDDQLNRVVNALRAKLGSSNAPNGSVSVNGNVMPAGGAAGAAGCCATPAAGAPGAGTAGAADAAAKEAQKANEAV